MRDYGKVAPTFWTRGSGKALRGNPLAQVVALYLFTSPGASMTGLYYLPLPTLCHETGLAHGAARESLKKLAELDLAFYDEAEGLVWVPEMAKYQIGPSLRAGDKRIRGVEREVETFRGHRFFSDFVARYKDAYLLAIEAPSGVFASPIEAPSKPHRSQDKYDLAPAHELARVPAPEGGAGGGLSHDLPPGVKLGSPDAIHRRPIAAVRLPDGPAATAIHEAMVAEPSLATVATVGLANRIAQETVNKKPLPEVLESIRAAAGKAADQAAGDNQLKQSDLINLVCGYATKPRPMARASPGRGSGSSGGIPDDVGRFGTEGELHAKSEARAARFQRDAAAAPVSQVDLELFPKAVGA